MKFTAIVCFISLAGTTLLLGDDFEIEPFNPEHGATIDEINRPDFESYGVAESIFDSLRGGEGDIMYRFHYSKTGELYTVVLSSRLLEGSKDLSGMAFVERRVLEDGKVRANKRTVDREFSLLFLETLAQLEIMELPASNSLAFYGGGSLGGDFIYAEELFGDRHRIVVRNTSESIPAQEAVNTLIPLLRDRAPQSNQ